MRHPGEILAEVDGADGPNLLVADRRDRRGGREGIAHDARAGDDHFFDRALLRRGVVDHQGGEAGEDAARATSIQDATNRVREGNRSDNWAGNRSDDRGGNGGGVMARHFGFSAIRTVMAEL